MLLPETSGTAPSSEPLSLNSGVQDFLVALGHLELGLKQLPGKIGPKFYENLRKILDQFLPPVYLAYDQYVSEVLKSEDREVTCGSGCSACCHHYVSSVEPFEILAIHLRIRGSERYSDLMFSSHSRISKFDRIRKEEGEDLEADDRALYRYFLRGAACPFLAKEVGKEGTCGIYDIRPMSCRMFFSESSPRFCSGTELASPWNRNFQVELPEVAEEALARCSEWLANLKLPEALFSGVLEANALFGQYDS